MNLTDLIVYLHDGAFITFQDFVMCMPNASIKALRLTWKELSEPLFPYLFRRIYLSNHGVDLEVFKRIAVHPRARLHVQELFWDDTSYAEAIFSLEAYKQRFLEVSTIQNRLDDAMILHAYDFWKVRRMKFAWNQETRKAEKTLRDCIACFPALASITLLGRSRLTYVDPQDYWQVWQTPRTRQWKREPFAHLLLDPAPYKPSFGTSTLNSEAVRLVKAISRLLIDDKKPIRT